MYIGLLHFILEQWEAGSNDESPVPFQEFQHEIVHESVLFWFGLLALMYIPNCQFCLTIVRHADIFHCELMLSKYYVLLGSCIQIRIIIS